MVMIYFAYVFIPVLIIQHGFAQLHQDDYEIVQDRITLTNYNKDYLKNPEIALFKYNDTLAMKAINISCLFLEEIKENILINARVFKYASDEYRPFPLVSSTEICEEYKTLGQRNPLGLKTAIEISNFRGCPFRKNKLYHLYNFILEDEKFLSHLPIGKYSLKLVCFIDDNKLLFEAYWYGELVARKGKKKNRRH